MNSITFDKNEAFNLSNLEKGFINARVGELLTKAQEYASLHLYRQADLADDSIPNLDKLCRIYQSEKIFCFRI